MSEYYTYRARVERVIDGDTFELFIDQGFEDYTVKTIRLKGVDTAEIHGTKKESDEFQRGMEQMRFVEDFLSGDEDWPLKVKTFGPGKYGGRWIGYVWNNEVNLTDALIEEWPEVAKDY